MEKGLTKVDAVILQFCLLEQETDIGIDAVFHDFVFVDLALHILDVNRLYSLQGFSGIRQRIGRRILPALVRLGNYFDHFKHTGHGHFPSYERYWTSETADSAEPPSSAACRSSN